MQCGGMCTLKTYCNFFFTFFVNKKSVIYKTFSQDETWSIYLFVFSVDIFVSMLSEDEIFSLLDYTTYPEVKAFIFSLH